VTFDELGRRQWGLITWQQLLTFMTAQQARDEIAGGRLIVVRRGIYRIAGVVEQWRHRPMAAYLAAGIGAASGTCAGRLLGMQSVPGQRVELVVPRPHVVRLSGVKVRTSNFLPSHHVDCLDALAVTTPARTICDLSATLSRPTVARILRSAVRLDLTSYDAVWRVREEVRARGRRRTTVIDELFEGLIVGAEPGDSDGEYKLLEWIAGAGLPLPKQQLWVVTAGGRYCLDLGYREEKIDLEWDSDLHERTPDDVEYDAARDVELELSGWFVMRASRLTKKYDFLRRLRSALERRSL